MSGNPVSQLPLCDRCHKPVCQIGEYGVWGHYYTEDFHGPCWWGKPWPFGQVPQGAGQ